MWSVVSIRNASTLAAVKKGLRAEKHVSSPPRERRGGPRGRERPQVTKARRHDALLPQFQNRGEASPKPTMRRQSDSTSRTGDAHTREQSNKRKPLSRAPPGHDTPNPQDLPWSGMSKFRVGGPPKMMVDFKRDKPWAASGRKDPNYSSQKDVYSSTQERNGGHGNRLRVTESRRRDAHPSRRVQDANVLSSRSALRTRAGFTSKPKDAYSGTLPNERRARSRRVGHDIPETAPFASLGLPKLRPRSNPRIHTNAKHNSPKTSAVHEPHHSSRRDTTKRFERSEQPRQRSNKDETEMNTIDDIHGELGNLYLASHLGKGPYKNVRKDELAVRINNAMQKLPPSDGTLDSSQLTTAPDTLKKYFMELRPLMKQLHRVENLKDPHTKPVHHLERLRDPHIETAQSLIANIRAVLHDLNRTIEIAEYSTSAKRQQISLLAYSLLGQTSRRREPRLLATSEKKPQNIQESLLWMCRGHEGEGLELALSKTIAAAVGEGIDGRKVQRHSKTGKESQLALEDEFDSPTSHAVNQTRDQHPRTVEIEEEELRYLRNRADRTSIEDTVGKLRGNTARDDTDIPLSIPRTTAASTFLYGANTVLAALRAHRRKLYKLYLHPRPLENPLQPGTNNRALLIRAAKDLDVDVRKNSSQDLLDAMSDNRPHNGVVLEASQLPAPPVRSLGKVKMDSGVIPLYLEAQNAEDAAVNGSPRIVRLATTARHPFVLMLDGILDPQNMGNIMRTAFFYGVDAVAVSVNTCCPLNSPTLAKASSGACEALEIWALKGPANFVRASKFSGWKVVAAVAPDGNVDVTSHVQVAASSPLRSHPTILMLGAEGTGLRESLKARADYFVSISAGLGSPDGDSEPANLSPSQRERLRMRREVGVDSINVGTAAGVLIDCFLRGALAGNSKHGVVEAEVVREGSPEAALSSRTLSNDEDSETFGDEAHQSEMEADVGSERVRAAVS